MDSGFGAALASARVKQPAHAQRAEALGRPPGMAFPSLAAALSGWEAVWTKQPLWQTSCTGALL